MQSDHAAFEAWRAYVSVGRIDAHLLRLPVSRAWERCHLAGANPLRMRTEVLSGLELERRLEANDELIGAAKPYLRALSRAAGADHHAATLGDAHAVVLDVLGDDATLQGPGRAPGPGSLLSEHHAGSNGVGTPLAEGDYVEVAGPEHFIRGFQPFTCQGVPLRGFDGATVGTLCIAVLTSRAADRLRRIAKVAARGVEAELIVNRLRTRLRELPRGDEWVQLERLHQDVVQIHTTSRLEFDLAAFELSRTDNADKLIRGTRELIDRFARLSRLWRMLADPTVLTVVELDADQLVCDSVDLLQTEARLARVELRLATRPCGRILVDPQLVRTLVHGHVAALRSAGEAGWVEVANDERGRVWWNVVPIRDRPLAIHYDMQVLDS